MSTVGELLQEKKENFYNFLVEVIENEETTKMLTTEEYDRFKECITKLKDAKVELFIYYVTKELLPQKDNLNIYVNTFLCKNGINEMSVFLDDDKLKECSEVLVEYKSKVKRYLKLFIDILEYSFE